MNQSRKHYFPVYPLLADPRIVGTEGNRNYSDPVPFDADVDAIVGDAEQPETSLEQVFEEQLDRWASDSLATLDNPPTRIANYLIVCELHSYISDLYDSGVGLERILRPAPELPVLKALSRVCSQWIRDSMARMQKQGMHVKRALLAETM